MGLASATTSLALGGNAKSIARSSKTAMSAYEYNSALHPAIRYGVPMAADALLATEAVGATAAGAVIIQARY